MPSTIQALKEGFSYLGRKIDELKSSKQSVQIDVGEQFTKTASKAMKDALSSKEIKVDAPPVSFESLNKNFQSLEQAIKGKNNQDVVDALAQVRRSVENIEMIAPETDMRGVIDELKTLGKKIESIPVAKMPDYSKEFNKLGEKLDKLADKKMEFPKEFKMDKMQLSEIAKGSWGGVGTPTVATRVEVSNVALADADTEYSFTFPASTVSWELRVRDTNVPLLLAYESGKLPTSGDGTAYFTVPAYYVQNNSHVNWGGKTLYLQTGSSSQTVEFIVYKA